MVPDGTLGGQVLAYTAQRTTYSVSGTEYWAGYSQGQRVSRCAVCVRHQRQYFFSSNRSRVFVLFFVVT